MFSQLLFHLDASRDREWSDHPGACSLISASLAVTHPLLNFPISGPGVLGLKPMYLWEDCGDQIIILVESVN